MLHACISRSTRLPSTLAPSLPSPAGPVYVPCAQVLDDTAGPITRKEYELMQAPAGDSLYGAVVNYIGQPILEIDTPGGLRCGRQTAGSKLAAALVSTADTRGHVTHQACMCSGYQLTPRQTPQLIACFLHRCMRSCCLCLLYLPENRKLIKAHKAAVLAAAAAAGSSGSSSSAAADRPLVTTSWDEDGGGPDVAGSGMNAIGLERLKPLINQQVAMKNREQITESLFTGVRLRACSSRCGLRVWLLRGVAGRRLCCCCGGGYQ